MTDTIDPVFVGEKTSYPVVIRNQGSEPADSLRTVKLPASSRTNGDATAGCSPERSAMAFCVKCKSKTMCISKVKARPQPMLLH